METLESVEEVRSNLDKLAEAEVGYDVLLWFHGDLFPFSSSLSLLFLLFPFLQCNLLFFYLYHIALLETLLVCSSSSRYFASLLYVYLAFS